MAKVVYLVRNTRTKKFVRCGPKGVWLKEDWSYVEDAEVANKFIFKQDAEECLQECPYEESSLEVVAGTYRIHIEEK